MRRTPLYMALYAATLLLLGGCRKDLCYDHPDHAFSVQVNLTATWEQEWERSYRDRLAVRVEPCMAPTL